MRLLLWSDEDAVVVVGFVRAYLVCVLSATAQRFGEKVPFLFGFVPEVSDLQIKYL